MTWDDYAWRLHRQGKLWQPHARAVRIPPAALRRSIEAQRPRDDDTVWRFCVQGRWPRLSAEDKARLLPRVREAVWPAQTLAVPCLKFDGQPLWPSAPREREREIYRWLLIEWWWSCGCVVHSLKRSLVQKGVRAAQVMRPPFRVRVSP